jgi:uroporphyrinogen decarboxylase
MDSTPRDRMLAACRGQAVDRPPVWLMRQAGRYLPEYRALRERHGFWDLVRRPELSVELALQPLRRFAVDATIVFSDILVLPDAMGARVQYEGAGPRLERPFQGEDDLARLADMDLRRDLAYLGEAVAGLAAAVHPERAVIGFAGAPLTLAAYLVEGGASKDLRGLKALAYRDPELARRLLEGLADRVAELLRLQVEAGADLVQVFDSWAGLLSPRDYRDLALPAVRRVFSRIADLGVPRVLYLRGAASHLEAAAESGADVLSVDQSVTLAQARARLGPGSVFQGNLDPAELFGPPARIRARVRDLCAEVGGRGWIANLGQGVVPEIPVEGVAAFVDAVVELG